MSMDIHVCTCVSQLKGLRRACCSCLTSFWLLQEHKSLQSAKEWTLRSKVEADSIVTAAILPSMFPGKRAGCHPPFFQEAGRMEQDMSVLMHAGTGLQKQGRKLRGCEETAVGAWSVWMETEVIPPQKCPSSYGKRPLVPSTLNMAHVLVSPVLLQSCPCIYAPPVLQQDSFIQHCLCDDYILKLILFIAHLKKHW